MKKEIEELLNSDLTSYRIAKETGITKQQIARYRKSSKVGNITLDNAIKLYNFYRKNKENRRMLKLSFKYKGQNKEVYSNSLEDVTREAFEYFKNDEHANEVFEKGAEEFIKDYLNGEVKYVGETIQYFKDIETVWDMDHSQTLEFINSLDNEIKQYIQLDTFNDEYYIEYDRGAYQISEQLTELAEQFLYE